LRALESFGRKSRDGVIKNTHMSIKNWFAGSVVGPKGYGGALGQPAREAGSALGNAVFGSHGSKSNRGVIMIFDTLSDMQSAGFEPYSEEPKAIELIALNESQQFLFKNLHIAMISYVFLVNSNAALQYMQRDNTAKFRNGLGPSLLKSMVDCDLFDDIEAARVAVLSYVNSIPSIRTVLNTKRPASEDLLEHFITTSVKASSTTLQYALVRTGITGFDTLAITVAEETLKSILAATKSYNW